MGHRPLLPGGARTTKGLLHGPKAAVFVVFKPRLSWFATVPSTHGSVTAANSPASPEERKEGERRLFSGERSRPIHRPLRRTHPLRSGADGRLRRTSAAAARSSRVRLGGGQAGPPHPRLPPLRRAPPPFGKSGAAGARLRGGEGGGQVAGVSGLYQRGANPLNPRGGKTSPRSENYLRGGGGLGRGGGWGWGWVARFCRFLSLFVAFCGLLSLGYPWVVWVFFGLSGALFACFFCCFVVSLCCLCSCVGSPRCVWWPRWGGWVGGLVGCVVGAPSSSVSGCFASPGGVVFAGGPACGGCGGLALSLSAAGLCVGCAPRCGACGGVLGFSPPGLRGACSCGPASGRFVWLAAVAPAAVLAVSFSGRGRWRCAAVFRRVALASGRAVFVACRGPVVFCASGPSRFAAWAALRGVLGGSFVGAGGVAG